jgi:Timeless protein
VLRCTRSELGFCSACASELHSALRRDVDATRDITIQLSKWKVPQTKLLPLLVECRDDAELVKTVSTALVITVVLFCVC